VLDDDKLCYQLALANLAVARCHAQQAEDACKVARKLFEQTRLTSDTSLDTTPSTDQESFLAYVCDGVGYGGPSNANTGISNCEGIWKSKAHTCSAGEARGRALGQGVRKTAAAVLLHSRGQTQPIERKDAQVKDSNM
jgi:hypothetical protein